MAPNLQTTSAAVPSFRRESLRAPTSAPLSAVTHPALLGSAGTGFLTARTIQPSSSECTMGKFPSSSSRSTARSPSARSPGGRSRSVVEKFDQILASAIRQSFRAPEAELLRHSKSVSDVGTVRQLFKRASNGTESIPVSRGAEIPRFDLFKHEDSRAAFRDMPRWSTVSAQSPERVSRVARSPRLTMSPRSTRSPLGQSPRSRLSPRVSSQSVLEKRAVQTWNADDVRIWCFDVLNLPLLAEMFYCRGITGRHLLDMTEEKLQTEFGVGRETKEKLESTLGSRLALRKIIGHINLLKTRDAPTKSDSLASLSTSPSGRQRSDEVSGRGSIPSSSGQSSAPYIAPYMEPFSRANTSPKSGTFTRERRGSNCNLVRFDPSPGACHYRNAAPPPPKVTGGTMARSQRWSRERKVSPDRSVGPWTYNPRHHGRSDFEKRS